MVQLKKCDCSVPGMSQGHPCRIRRWSWRCKGLWRETPPTWSWRSR